MNWRAVTRLSVAWVAVSLCASSALAEDTAAKVAPPDSKALAKELKLVGQVYKDEIAGARSSAEKTALAKKLIRLAGESKEKDAEQYGLYSEAQDLAAQAGDARTAFAALDQLSARFEIDAPAAAADLLTKTAAALRAKSDHKAFFERCDLAMDDAVAQERHDVARRLSDLQVAAARSLGDAAALKWASARAGEIRAAKTAFDKQKLALATLGQNPADPEANLVVGRYRCFVIGDWKNGLPLLARGADAPLKSIAGQEIVATDDAKAKAALADLWWDRAAKEQGLPQRRIGQRAAVLYNEALPALTGLDKVKVERRLAAQAAVANGNGSAARILKPNEIAARFTFPNKTFHLDGDAITGTAESADDPGKYVWLTDPETLQSFEFGFSIKAKWYQMAALEIDGQRYFFSRGHWANGDSGIFVEHKSERRIGGTVTHPDEWASMRVQVAEDKITYSYNGEIVGTCDLIMPMTKTSSVKVGFTSHNTPFSIKDVFLAGR